MRLLTYKPVRLATDGNVHGTEPSVHGRTKFHVAAASADSLGLEIQKDHTGDGPVRDTYGPFRDVEFALDK